jgi:hypothetical protein
MFCIIVVSGWLVMVIRAIHMVIIAVILEIEEIQIKGSSNVVGVLYKGGFNSGLNGDINDTYGAHCRDFGNIGDSDYKVLLMQKMMLCSSIVLDSDYCDLVIQLQALLQKPIEVPLLVLSATENLESASFAIEDDAIPASFGVISQQCETSHDLGVSASRLILKHYRYYIHRRVIVLSGPKKKINRLPRPLSDQVLAFIAENRCENVYYV